MVCCINDWYLQALDIDPKNIKALVRRGKAHIELDDWESARQDLNAALEIEPNNADVKKEFARLNKKIADQNAKDKRTFKGLFEKLSKMEEKEQPKEEKKEVNGEKKEESTSAS
jgi:tetratricopeptide (TPR) repeat protein